MTTNNTRKFVVALFVIAFFAIMLSACSPSQLVAAGYSGDAPAYQMNVNPSPRLEGCDMSSKQMILNEAGALGDNAATITVDNFLNDLMPKHGCIAGK